MPRRKKMIKSGKNFEVFVMASLANGKIFSNQKMTLIKWLEMKKRN